MEKIEPTWTNTLPVWWSFAWRFILFGGVAGGIAGAIVGFILAVIGKSELMATYAIIIGYIVSIIVSVWCIKHILSKRFNGFSVSLIKDEIA